MYSCANYPRGCRGRANVEGGKCADCVVCSLSGHASWTKTNILPEPQTSSPIGSLIAFCAAQGLSQSASLGDPERLSIQGNPPWIMRQMTKEKTTTMTVGTQKILSTGLKQCLGTGPKRTSVVSLPPLFSLQWFNFLLHFSFFWPPLRVLQFIIRLNASPGVSYFSHSFNIFRGRHLFACLFVCLFFLPKINSPIDSAFRFDMVRQSETSIYYGVNFILQKWNKKYENKKRIGSARLISQRTGYHGLFIGSDLLLASSELGWLGLISWWMVDIRFGLSCLLACLRDFLISWLNMLAALLLSFALEILLHICPRFHRFVPTYPDPVYYLRYYCSIPMYLTYY